MSKLAKVLEVTEDEKQAILKHYSLTEEMFLDNVRILKEWVRQSEHLPQEEDENKLRLVLFNAKMSLEKAKQTIENYYRIRSMYSDELFSKLNPSCKEYQKSKNLVTTVALPRLTPDLCRITFFKMRDPEGEADDAFIYEIPVFMMAELRIVHDMCLSNIIIIDFSGYSWKNLLKFTPTVNQKLVDIMNAINLRIKNIHFINTMNFLDHVMRLLKVFLPSKILNKIVIHKTADTLTDYIPKEYIPSNYGGSEKSLEELYEEWCDQIEKSQEMFDELLQLKYTAKVELDNYQKDMFGCGVEGSFKQLAID